MAFVAEKSIRCCSMVLHVSSLSKVWEPKKSVFVGDNSRLLLLLRLSSSFIFHRHSFLMKNDEMNSDNKKKNSDYSKDPYLRITFYFVREEKMENRNEKTPIKNNWRTIVNQVRRANRCDAREHQKNEIFYSVRSSPASSRLFLCEPTQSPAALNQLNITYFDAMNESAFVFAARYRETFFFFFWNNKQCSLSVHHSA